MFNNLRDTIKELNADVNNVANCEKAKALRKKLLIIGLPMAILGFLGVFVCFVLFATAGFDAFDPNGGFTARVMVPFILFLPCGAVGGIGAQIAALGFKIVVTGYTSNLINETVGNNCPNCGATITSETHFCPKCGTQIKAECPSCHHVNSVKNDFCEKCGTRLR